MVSTDFLSAWHAVSPVLGLMLLAVGVALTYLGGFLPRPLGMIAGAASGALVAAGAMLFLGADEGQLIGALLLGGALAVLGFFMPVVFAAIAGAAVGAALLWLTGPLQPIVYLPALALGGGIALLLHRQAQVTLTSFLGGLALTVAVLMLITADRGVFPPDLLVQAADPFRLVVQYLLIFLLFFFSGMGAQIGIHHWREAVPAEARGRREPFTEREAGRASGPKPRASASASSAPASGPSAGSSPPATEPQPASPPASRWFVILYSPDTAPRRLAIDTRPMVLGRAADCRIQIDDARASREHLRLRCTPQGVKLDDLGSTNGTWQRGRKRISSVIARHGDWFMIGETRLLIEGATAP